MIQFYLKKICLDKGFCSHCPGNDILLLPVIVASAFQFSLGYQYLHIRMVFCYLGKLAVMKQVQPAVSYISYVHGLPLS